MSHVPLAAIRLSLSEDSKSYVGYDIQNININHLQHKIPTSFSHTALPEHTVIHGAIKSGNIGAHYVRHAPSKFEMSYAMNQCYQKT
jgi:hypothetical protein